MRLKINPGRASGKIVAPPSKSMAHRLLISAAMSEGESRISDLPECLDVLATMDCLSSLGVKIERNGDTVTVHGRDFRDISPREPLPCRESGSTLRFLIPPAMLCGKQVVFVCRKKGAVKKCITANGHVGHEQRISFCYVFDQ